LKLVVTGGAGYIGSVVADALLARRHEVCVLDNLATGHRSAVPTGARFVEGDVRDTRALARALTRDTDAVLHFAASSVVADSVQRPQDYFDNNMGGAVSLLREMEKVGVKRLVFSSTAAVYGAPEKLPIEEDAPCAPENPYGWSKLMIERALEAARAGWGLAYVALRYFNAGGATDARGEDHRPESHLIPIVLDVALGTRASVTVFGDDYATRDGTCLRDYIHVSDLADAHVLALDAMTNGFSGALNLGSETGCTVLEVIRTVERVAQCKINYQVGPRRAGDPPALLASSRKASQTLRWTPRVSDLDAIVRSAHAWRRTHPRGYDS
jgi:UDP-glucose 4-epimerase